MNTNSRMIFLEDQIIDKIATISTRLRFNKKVSLEEEDKLSEFLLLYKNESLETMISKKLMSNLGDYHSNILSAMDYSDTKRKEELLQLLYRSHSVILNFFNNTIDESPSEIPWLKNLNFYCNQTFEDVRNSKELKQSLLALLQEIRKGTKLLEKTNKNLACKLFELLIKYTREAKFINYSLEGLTQKHFEERELYIDIVCGIEEIFIAESFGVYA